jgi:type 1 fimbriae regulatory protein FimB
MTQGNNRTVRYLDRAQTTRFFSVIESPRDRALFATIYHYGLRVSEATLLRLDDVDLERRCIFVRRVKHGLGGERPLFRNTARLLKSYLEVRAPTGSALFTGRRGNLSRYRIQQLFREYAHKAGLEGQFTVHSLRHSIATHLLEAGQGIEFVQDHLGHVNIQNTLIYARLTDRRREAIYRQVEESPEIVKA